jgi:hypothetical protein
MSGVRNGTPSSSRVSGMDQSVNAADTRDGIELSGRSRLAQMEYLGDDRVVDL